MPFGRSQLLSALHRAAKASPADETLVAARRGGQTTLRFSGGQIYQNFHEEAVTVWIKVACGTQVGVATTSSLTLGAPFKSGGFGHLHRPPLRKTGLPRLPHFRRPGTAPHPHHALSLNRSGKHP